MINKQFELLRSEEETEQNIDSSSSKQLDMNVMDRYRSSILYVLLASVLLTSALNLLTPKSNEIYQQLYDDQLESISEEQEQQLIKKLETEYKNNAYKISFGNKSLERITYGQPRPKNSFLRVVIFRKKGTSKARQCLFTNGVNIISNKTTDTGKIFMSQKQINRWILLLPNIDLVADDIINKFMNETDNIYEKQTQQLKIDSHYKFIRSHTIDCDSIIYVQNNFMIDEQNKNQILEAHMKAKQTLKDSYCMYSKNAHNLEDKSIKLQSLKNIDLSQFKQQKFNQYVYIFTTDFFSLITPLNYVHFNKYTIQQIIVYPILAITQKSHKLIEIQKGYHKFDQAVVQFKQFQLIQPPRITPKKSFCFLSYPVDPRVISIQHFKDYIKSLQNLNIQEEKIIIIIYVPYNFKQNKQELNEIYNELIKIQKEKRFYTIKIRIQQARAVSSIAAYQSAHTYCPEQSYIISSRLNIIFDPEIINKLIASITQKVHYYSVNPRLLSQKVKGLLSNHQSIRFDVQKYLTQFSEVQIFKVQLMKMINLWTLKSEQSKFFQSQASFILPLLQMCDHFVKKISESQLYVIRTPRKISIEQNLEMKLLQKYSIWDKIKDNILIPIKHNSLTNLDLRRGALDNIPKIIHQIWFRQQAIPQKIHKLQDTIKQVNKDYKYIMWRKQNLTTYDFPMSYNHIAKIYQYQWVNKKSYHPWIQALMSYEILYNHGGIYLSLKVEAKKPLDPFLKYQLFFAGYYNNIGNYGSPMSIGREIMGSKVHGYHMRFIISELITQQRINLELTDYQALVGGDIVRVSLSDSELYTTTAFGFHLFNYDPMRKGPGLCDNEPIPCKHYTESYIVIRNLN